MSNSKVWFNRHFSCVAKVILELRKETYLRSLQFLVSHRHSTFAGYEVADESFVEPSNLPSSSYLDWMLDTVQQKSIDILVPGHEQSFLTSHSAEFLAKGCRVFEAAPAAMVGGLHCKDWVYHQSIHAVPLPHFFVVQNAAEFTAAVAAIRDTGAKPCIKPVNSVYGLGFYQITKNEQPRSSLCQSETQWLRRFASNDTFAPQLVMEYLPGHEFSVDVAARHGETLAVVIRRKPLRPGPQKIVAHAELMEYTSWLVKRFQLNGLVNIQFREDRRHKAKLLEINPRASGGIGMSCQSGVNLPYIAYRAFLEPSWLPFPIPQAQVGRSVFESAQEPMNPNWQLHTKQTEEVESEAVSFYMRRIDLPTGKLTVRFVEQSHLKADSLLGFGARNNIKRGFLFVSKVLGKHIPVKPAVMREVHQQLASKIVSLEAERQKRPIVIGMAETATGLGMGIFGELQELTSRKAWPSFFHTTRYPQAPSNTRTSDVLQFEEAHSHATQLSLEMPPKDSEHYQTIVSAETVLLIDDEISTGKTFANLVQTLQRVSPGLKHVIVATITDLSDGKVEELISGLPGIASIHVVSLLTGSYEFQANTAISQPTASTSTNASTGTTTQIHWSPYSARQGLSTVCSIPQTLLSQCVQHLTTSRCRVIGTNEFMDPAYRLGLQLETLGFEATVQSTTRSPLLISHDIKLGVRLADPYCPITQNYLYNFAPDENESVIVVHESANQTAIDTLVTSLGQSATRIELNLLNGTVSVH